MPDRRRAAALLAAVVGAALLVGCSRGGERSPRATTDEREVAAFTRVVLTEPLATTIEVGGEPSVVVQTDTDLVGQVATAVDGDVLTVRAPKGFQPRTPSRVTIRTPSLSGLAVVGGRAGTVVRVQAVRGDTLDVEAAGAAVVGLDGEVGTLRVRVAGAAAVQGFGLKAAEAEVTTISTGDVQVAVTGSLRAEVGSSGNVVYRGDPEISQTVTGSGRVVAG